MKCKFYKKCKLYNDKSNTCNKEGGIYYGGNKPAGCYRKMTAQQRKEEMYICLAEQGFSAEWMGMVAFDLGVVIKIEKILELEDLKDS